MRKFSLLFAAAVMAFSMQIVRAEDEILTDDDVIDIVEQAEGGVGRWRRGHRSDTRKDWGRRPGAGGDFGPCEGYGCKPFRQGMGRGRGMGMGHGEGRHGMFGPRFMEELELTADQKARIIDVVADNFKSRLQAKMELHDAISALRDLRESDAPEADALIAANVAVAAAQGKMEVLDRGLKTAVRAVMTPEQTAKLDEMMENGRGEWRKMRREGDENRGGRRGPGHREPGMRRGPGPRAGE